MEIDCDNRLRIILVVVPLAKRGVDVDRLVSSIGALIAGVMDGPNVRLVSSIGALVVAVIDGPNVRLVSSIGALVAAVVDGPNVTRGKIDFRLLLCDWFGFFVIDFIGSNSGTGGVFRKEKHNCVASSNHLRSRA